MKTERHPNKPSKTIAVGLNPTSIRIGYAHSGNGERFVARMTIAIFQHLVICNVGMGQRESEKLSVALPIESLNGKNNDLGTV